MSTFEFRPAAEYKISQIAELLTCGFEEYFVPIHITESVLLTMMRHDSIDLSSSRVLIKEDVPIGVALIARRGWTSRLAAMGIVINARNNGAGTWAMKHLIDEARARGEREMVLEVIEKNVAGVKLYQKFGFESVRRLVGYKLEKPQSNSTVELEEMDIRELARLVTYHGLPNLPWQLTGATIMQHTPPSRAFRLDDAYCLISDPSLEQVVVSSVLVKTRSRGAGFSPVLLRAVFARFPNKTWHVPAIFPEEMSSIFEEVGMQREEISQWQMALKL
jgi:L-amino acid N-acyltransferase YncA